MKIPSRSTHMISLSPNICFFHIQKYSQYAQNESWARWYASVAPLKAQRVVKVLLRYKNKRARLLDLGSGTGMTFVALAQTFPNATALDIGESEIQATKELLSALHTNATVKKYNGKTIPFPRDTFDIVTSIEVIEHADNPTQMLSEIQRVLKKDGILHITSANRWWPIEPHFKLPFLSYLPSQLADAYVRLSGRGKSYHDIRLPGYRQFRRIVQQFFTVEDITLETIRNFKVYDLDKERGSSIRMLGKFLSYVERLHGYPVFRPLGEGINSFLSSISLGWLFIAHPKK